MSQPPSESSAGTYAAHGPRAKSPTVDALAAGEISKDNLFSQFTRMVGAFWASRERTELLLLAAGLVAVVAATAYVQIRLNAWNEPFYDALTRKNTPQVLRQLVVFGELAAVLLVLNVA